MRENANELPLILARVFKPIALCGKCKTNFFFDTEINTALVRDRICMLFSKNVQISDSCCRFNLLFLVIIAKFKPE